MSIYSPPYFTSPQGYQMCTRVYLNGDGIGKGTHISVFFVLMKLEHDSLLQWPFKQSVCFTLINQVNQSASITEAFAPDLKSPSFWEPEMNWTLAMDFQNLPNRVFHIMESDIILKEIQRSRLSPHNEHLQPTLLHQPTGISNVYKCTWMGMALERVHTSQYSLC